MSGQLEFDFGIAVTADYDDDGHLQIQTDATGDPSVAGTHPCEVLLPHGFLSSPLEPEGGGGGVGTPGEIGIGAPVFKISHGDNRFVFPLNDPRDVKKVPALRRGGTMMHGGAGEVRSFVSIEGLDPNATQTSGSIMMMAAYGTAVSKKALGVLMNVRTPGQEELTVVHGNGHRITLNAQGSIVLSSADGGSYFETSDEGNVLAGETRVQGSLQIGALMAAQPVALWTQLLVYLQALEAALTVGNGGGPIAVALPIATLATAIKSKHLTST